MSQHQVTPETLARLKETAIAGLKARIARKEAAAAPAAAPPIVARPLAPVVRDMLKKKEAAAAPEPMSIAKRILMKKGTKPADADASEAMSMMNHIKMSIKDSADKNVASMKEQNPKLTDDQVNRATRFAAALRLFPKSVKPTDVKEVLKKIAGGNTNYLQTLSALEKVLDGIATVSSAATDKDTVPSLSTAYAKLYFNVKEFIGMMKRFNGPHGGDILDFLPKLDKKRAVVETLRREQVGTNEEESLAGDYNQMMTTWLLKRRKEAYEKLDEANKKKAKDAESSAHAIYFGGNENYGKYVPYLFADLDAVIDEYLPFKESTSS